MLFISLIFLELAFIFFHLSKITISLRFWCDPKYHVFLWKFHIIWEQCKRIKIFANCILTTVEHGPKITKSYINLLLKQSVVLALNTLYMTNSTLVSPVKMEYGWNFSISGPKMMMKSGLGKIFLKFLHALTVLFLLLNLYFWS